MGSLEWTSISINGNRWRYTPLGGEDLYRKAATANLLLLGVLAARQVVHLHGSDPTLLSVLQTITQCARGKRPKLTLQEYDAICDEDSPAHAVVAGFAWACYQYTERFDTVDGLGRAILHVVERSVVALVAPDLRSIDRTRGNRIHHAEARLLIHEWTKTIDVVPAAVVSAVLVQPTLEQAMVTLGSILGMGGEWTLRTPMPPTVWKEWASSPGGLREAAERAERARAEAERSAAYQARLAAMSPEERALHDAELEASQAATRGLLMRDVQ